MATRKRIFCDTNFLLDLFDAERTCHDDAVALLWYCSDNAATAEPIASITSFKDAYYILTRLYRDEGAARRSIDGIMGAFIRPVDMLGRYGEEALGSDEPDFEDGLIRACAEHEQADVIISRDAKAFAACSIPVRTAAAFLAEEGFDYETISW